MPEPCQDKVSLMRSMTFVGSRLHSKWCSTQWTVLSMSGAGEMVIVRSPRNSTEQPLIQKTSLGTLVGLGFHYAPEV